MIKSKRYLLYLYAAFGFLMASILIGLFAKSLATDVVVFDHLKAVSKSDLLLLSSGVLALAGLLDWGISKLSTARNEKYRKIQTLVIITSVLLFNILLLFSPISPKKYHSLQNSSSFDSAFLGIDLLKFVSTGIRILAIIFSLFLLMLFIEFLYRTFRRV